ncbi:hypothetical protein ABWH97_13805 [Nitratireductor sp. ac15]
MSEADCITPEYIERLIDETGRARVFSRAREIGWKDGGAPLWVWKEICADILHEDHRRNAQP